MDNQNSNTPYQQYYTNVYTAPGQPNANAPYQQYPTNGYIAPKQPSGWGKLWAALALALVVFFTQVIGILLGMVSRSDTAMFATAEVVGGIAAMLFVFALGGKKLATPSMDGVKETWQLIRWIFITDAVIAVIEIVGTVAGGELVLAPDWFLRTLLLAILCIGVGMFEEFTFRGLVFHGLLSRMGITNKGIFWAVIISSLIFGLMHIDPINTNWADPSQFLQALLKVAQTGIFGFAAAVAVLRTGNIWPIALFHCLNDFILMFITNGLMENPISTEYVLSGEEGLAVIAVYLVLIFAYSPALVASVRALKEHAAPNRGQFYRARTYPAGYVAAPPVAYAAPVPQTAYAVPQGLAPQTGYVGPQGLAPQTPIPPEQPARQTPIPQEQPAPQEQLAPQEPPQQQNV